MADIQEPPPAQETYRVHDVLEDDEREPTKDFKQYMELDEDEGEKQPSPMEAFSPQPMTVLQSDTPQIEALSLPQLEAIAHELIETITVIEDKGIQTTTVDIGKGQFKGSSIKIALYDTHPTSYNIELIGAPDAVLKFHQGLPTLHSLLTTALPEHVFQLQSSLSDHHQSELKKREKQRVQKTKSSR